MTSPPTAAPPRVQDTVASTTNGVTRRWVAYAAVLALTLVPVLPPLFMSYIPTVDGPAHVFEGFVLAHHGEDGFGRITEEYVLSAAPSPNLLGEAVLALMLEVISPGAAEKLVGVLGATLFALAMTFAVRSVAAERTWLAAVAAPLATGYLYYAGFYNFVVGTGLFLLTTGVFLRHRNRWRPGSALLLAALLLLTASSHLMPFVMATGVISLVLIVDLVEAGRSNALSGARPETAMHPVRRLLAVVAVPAAAWLIPGALSLWFLVGSAEIRADEATQVSIIGPEPPASPPWQVLARLSAGQIAFFATPEAGFGLLLVLNLLMLSGYVLLHARHRLRRGPTAALAAMAVLSLTALAVVPDAVGTLAFIQRRFVYFSMLFVILAVAAVSIPPRLRTLAVGIAVVTTVGVTAVRVPAQLDYNDQLRELDSVAAVMRPGSTFATFRLTNGDPPMAAGLSPTAHASNRVAMATRGVNLNHLDARYAYFPAHFRDLDDLGARSTDLNDPRLWTRFLIQMRQDGTEPDYVALWGGPQAHAALAGDPAYDAALRRLSSRYTRQWVSGPDQLLELYELCGDRCAAAPAPS